MTTRKYTNKIINLIAEGEINPNLLIERLLAWFPEHDVEEFYNEHLREFFEEDEDDQDI